MRPACSKTKLCIARLKTLFAISIMLLTAALLVSCAYGEPGKKGSDIKAMRKEAANKQRRFIFNNDGCDAIVFPVNLEPTPENFLAQRTLPLIGSQVDVLSYCTLSSGFGYFTHNTKIGDIFTGPHPAAGTKNITQDLIDQGTDTLQVMVDFCRKNDMEIFWSMRMNDTHDGDGGHRPDKPFFLFSPIKAQHPEYLVGTYTNKPPYGQWTSVNYAVPEVRDLAFKFIEEICQNYDIDGIELDFFRHMCYFKSVAFGGSASQAELDMMTDLIRRIRKMADRVGAQRGKAILIAVRVPDSVEYSRGVGLDIERWMADDLIDILISSGYFRFNHWDYSVNLAHKYGVKAYPCITDSRVGGEDEKFKRKSEKSLRARVMQAWAANPDGIYVFNHFQPGAQYMREIGDPKLLQKLDKVYFATFANRGYRGKPLRYLKNSIDFMNLKFIVPADPLSLSPQAPQQVEIVIGDDLSWTKNEPVEPQVKCYLRFEGLKSADDIVASLNGQMLKNGKLSGQWVEYSVDPAIVKKGINLVTLLASPQTADEPAGNETEIWNMTYNCDKLLLGSRQPPWRRLFGPNNFIEKIRDNYLYLADPDTGKSEWAAMTYPWRIPTGEKIVVEARCKVESSTDPLGVCIRVSNGQSVEYLTLEEHRIGLKYANIGVPMDTTSDFHTYRIIIDGKDIKVLVDGQLKLDGSGKFTTSAFDETKWISFIDGLHDWNKNCLLFGSATGPGTGAAYWDHIKYRAKKIALMDLVMTISYKEK